MKANVKESADHAQVTVARETFMAQAAASTAAVANQLLCFTTSYQRNCSFHINSSCK